jgi:hypothetical protein
MDAVKKEFDSRKAEIQSELELLFKANMKITDWDIPEVDDEEVANIIVNILQEKLDSIKSDIKEKKYNNY